MHLNREGYSDALMNLEDIILNEISHSQNTVLLHLYKVPRRARFLEKESTYRMVVAWGWGWGQILFNGYRASVLRLDDGDGHTTIGSVLDTTDLYT